MKNKKQKIIIGLVGLSACGKGTVAQYLKKKYNANTHKFSIILRDILNRLYYKIDRTSLQTLSTILRTNFGEDVLAKVIARDVKNDKNKIIVVDGIRRMDDIKYLKKLDHFLLFKIIVKPKIRYKRLVQRNENLGDTKKTYKEFLDDEKKEADLKIPLVMQKAKYAIDNNGSFKELHKQISHNVERITHNVMRSTLCVPRYMIFGPQGSGKGTQAKVLSAKLNIPHISTGSIFREQIKKQTALGKKIKNIVRQGKLISDIITNKVLKKRLSAKDCRAGFILDGYPRNLTQAKFLDKLINTTLALEIWISDKEAVKRISQRRICVKCGAIYHLEFNPPATDNICDLCHSKLSVRKDDKKQAIQKRLRAYHSQTALLINYYKKRKVYKKINGMPSIKEVSKKIYKMIE